MEKAECRGTNFGVYYGTEIIYVASAGNRVAEARKARTLSLSHLIYYGIFNSEIEVYMHFIHSEYVSSSSFLGQIIH